MSRTRYRESLTESTSPQVSELKRAELREVMAGFPAGVAIVTALGNDGVDYGFTASSLCSVSLEPELISVCIGKKAGCYPVFLSCDYFVVSVLAAEQEELARRFGRTRLDKFDKGGFRRNSVGVLEADEAVAVVDCHVYARYPGGDHTILLGEVNSARIRPGTPLIFLWRRFVGIADEKN